MNKGRRTFARLAATSCRPMRRSVAPVAQFLEKFFPAATDPDVANFGAGNPQELPLRGFVDRMKSFETLTFLERHLKAAAP